MTGIWWKDVVYDYSAKGKPYIWLKYQFLFKPNKWAIFNQIEVYAAIRTEPYSQKDTDKGFIKKERIFKSDWHDKEEQCLTEVREKLNIPFNRSHILHERAISISVGHTWPFFDKPHDLDVAVELQQKKHTETGNNTSEQVVPRDSSIKARL